MNWNVKLIISLFALTGLTLWAAEGDAPLAKNTEGTSTIARNRNPLQEIKTDRIDRLYFNGKLNNPQMTLGALFSTQSREVIGQFVDCLKGLPEVETENVYSDNQLATVQIMDIDKNVLASISIAARQCVTIKIGTQIFKRNSRPLALMTFEQLAINVPKYLADGENGKYLLDIHALRKVFPFDGSCYARFAKASTYAGTTRAAEPPAGGDGKPAPQQ